MPVKVRSEEHTSELQSHVNLVCRLLLEKKSSDSPRSPMISSPRPIIRNRLSVFSNGSKPGFNCLRNKLGKARTSVLFRLFLLPADAPQKLNPPPPPAPIAS